ncbi:MAG TPA: 8-oxoguanine deaminase [Thermotogae bacterium]|nr:8-oxoguanine deaminase [Thermotogota bacterium]
MKKLLKNIDLLATFGSRGEITGGAVLIEDNVIIKVGKTEEMENIGADEVVDLSGRVVLPGFVNTHHHFYQTLFRNVKEVQSAKLFDWLVHLYDRWKHIEEEAVASSTKVAIYEMMKSGVTTTTDMFYLFPHGKDELFDVEIETAVKTGVRFHPTRGSMSLSRKDGGLPPDEVVEPDERILQENERVVKQYHDPRKYSMLRIALAPCSPFSVTPRLMRDTVELAEKYDVLLHTHLAETQDEEAFCIEKFRKRPVDYMEELGWLNPRVWFAHLVWLNEDDIKKLEEYDVGMAHCPVSNMRLGSGIAPVYEMKGRIRIGLAVDGSASNDTNNMIAEIRTAMLLQRVKYGADALTPREVLHMATVGGARVLRMDDYIGKIEEGYAADIVAFRLDTLEMSGCLDDPLAAIVMCDAKSADFVMINGVTKIKNGEFLDVDLEEIISKQNEISKTILQKL